MTTELSFLIELLLKHKLQPATKDAIAARIKDVESSFTAIKDGSNRIIPAHVNVSNPPAFVGGSAQSPSTLALLAKHPDLVQQMNAATRVEPPPVAVIAQTPAAVAALQSREASIAQAISGKVEKGRTSPRKF